MVASWPWRTSWRASSTTCFWAPPRVSSLMMNSTRTARLLGSTLVLPVPAAAPHLEGEQQPQPLHVQAVVPRTALAEIGDRAAHRRGVEEASFTDAPRREVLVHERGELAAQPGRERDREALLRALDELARHVPVEHLAQQVLRAERSAAHRERKAQRELDQAMVEHRLAPLEAGGHRGAIHFGEDVVGQVMAQVAVHHLVGDAARAFHALARAG